jgi:hypothetical protein
MLEKRLNMLAVPMLRTMCGKAFLRNFLRRVELRFDSARFNSFSPAGLSRLVCRSSARYGSSHVCAESLAQFRQSDMTSRLLVLKGIKSRCASSSVLNPLSILCAAVAV